MLQIRSHRGVTLLELMIMLAIIIIITVVSVPLFTSIIQNFRLSATADELYSALQNARTEAVKRNATVYVSFVTGDSWCYGLNVGSACTCTTPSGCSLGTTSATKAGLISLATTGLTNNIINFEGTHGAANATGSITLTLFGGTNLMTISVGRFGSLQICSTGVSGYTAC